MDKLIKYKCDRTKKISENKVECSIILDKLINIIGVTKDKNYFSLFEMDNEHNKINQIILLVPDIEKYFATSRMSYFSNKKNNKDSNRPYLNLIRNILKALDITYYNKVTSITIDGIKHNTIKYYINMDEVEKVLKYKILENQI
jgi:hypothetical protein